MQAARQTLGYGAAGSQALRQALDVARAEISTEAAALAASRAALLRDEQSLADFRFRAEQEANELTRRCDAARQWHRQEEQVASLCAEQIVAKRAEKDTEARAAQEHQRREQEAIALRERALRDLHSNEEVARRTLQEAIHTLELDFQRERDDFAERDRRALQQIQELERTLDSRRKSPLPTQSQSAAAHAHVTLGASQHMRAASHQPLLRSALAPQQMRSFSPQPLPRSAMVQPMVQAPAMVQACRAFPHGF